MAELPEPGGQPPAFAAMALEALRPAFEAGLVVVVCNPADRYAEFVLAGLARYPHVPVRTDPAIPLGAVKVSVVPGPLARRPRG